MTDQEIKETGIHDCSNCQYSIEVAPYKVVLKCKLDIKIYEQPHTCDRWESLLAAYRGVNEV